MEPASDRGHYVRREQVRLLYQNGSLVLGATAVLAAAIVLALWPVAASVSLITWLVCYLLVTALRIWLVQDYQRRRESRSTAVWCGLYVAGCTLAGATWGAAAIVFFIPAEPTYMLLLTCLYAVVVAVAAQPLGAYLPAFLLFSVTMILPLMGMLIAAGGDFYRPLGLLGFLYLIVVWGFGFNANRMIIESIKLRFENLDLVQKLSQQRAVAEENRLMAEQANVAKSKFLAAASHDLRQPLHALGLFHDALTPHVNGGGRWVMERMQQSITSLTGLFQSLLDISRLDAGVVEVNLEHLQAAKVIESLRQEYAPNATDKGLALVTRCDDSVVHSDRIMLERILRNLLTNAIRYTESGEVSINCREDRQRVRIVVTDSGPGIAEADFDNIFSEYHQLKNPTRDRTKGLGLGLSIVRRLCELLGGEIRVVSEVGKGSSFTVLLPAGDATEVARDRPPGSWDLRGARVLVVDDEEPILDSMGRVICRWGCEAILAQSIDEALKKMRADGAVPSAIIADYRLRDGETGIDAIERLRAQAGQRIPAILVSGDTAPERLQEVRASGLRLLHKPVMPGELRTALHQEIIDRPA